MKILMLVAPPHLKGPLPKITPQLIGALRDLGCDVCVQYWGRRNDVESLREKVWGRIADIWRVRGALARTRPDIVVVHTAHDWNTLVRDILLLLATRARRPITVLQLHGSQPETFLASGNALFTRASRWLLQLSDAVLVLSADEQSQWQRFYPAGRFERVSNPFTSDRVAVAFPRSVLARVVGHLERSEPLIVFVGRLMREKGILELLEAMAIIRDATPACLLVVGDGGLADDIALKVKSLGLERRVALAGYLRGAELDAAYAVATVFVLPTWWFEGFPTVIAEAMHAGAPVVTTRMRGMADHLEAGTNALFVPPRDSAALAAALLQLLGDESLRSRMGIANRNALARFSPDVVGKEYLDVLNAVAIQRGAERS